MSKQASLLDVQNVLKVVRRRAAKKNLSVTFSKNAGTAYTTGSSMVIPTPTMPITEESLDLLYGYVIHEAGHHTRPEAFDILNSAQPDAALAGLYNIIEDEGMERSVAEEHYGDAVALSKENQVLLNRAVEEFNELSQEDLDKYEYRDACPHAALVLCQEARKKWDKWGDLAIRKASNSLPSMAQELVEELTSEGWLDRIKATKTPHDTWDVACDLYKRLFGDDVDDDKLEEQRQQGHSMKGPPTDGQGGEEQETSASSERTEGRVVSWQDVVLSDHSDEGDEEHGSMGIDWTGYESNNVQLAPPGEETIIDCSKYDTVSNSDAFLSNDAHNRAFANRIRRYIQSTQKTRLDTERYHGRINKGALIRLAMPPIDGGDWNKRLFYDYTPKTALDTCVQVLVDWSGSMEGEKMENAADAGGRLVQTMDKVLHVPVQLAAFSYLGSDPVLIGMIKRFGEKKVTNEELSKRFAAFYPYSGGNNDADSLAWAYRQQLKRKEKRKILIVLSDGCPAGEYNMWSGQSNSDANLKYVANQIEKDGRVELYGVGIHSKAVSNYYKNHVVINNSNEINDILFNLIKEGV